MFGMYLVDNISADSNIHVLTADMSGAARLERFSHQYPDKYTDVGIAEQNLIGVSAGLASEGFHPIATAQATFISMRAFEMNRQYLGYMQNPVVLVGLNSGFLLQFMGNTHFALEDISILRMIPNMTVLSPADAGEAVSAMKAALESNKPTYIRLTGIPSVSSVYEEKCDFEIGKNITLREGSDLTIFATGSMVANCLKVADLLYEKHSIETKVVDVHSIKPLDVCSIKESKSAKLIVSVEEHFINGGLGSAIADVMAEESGYPTLLKLGVKDCFSTIGDYEYLLKSHRLTPDLIAEDIWSKYSVL